MKRRFTVDASKKVYAAIAPGEILLSSYMDSLVAYATPRITKAYDNAEKSLQRVISKYIKQPNELTEFNSCLNPEELNTHYEYATDVSELVYYADEDEAFTWIGVFFKEDNNTYANILERLEDETDFSDDVGQYYLGDHFPKDTPVIVAPTIRDFVLSLILHLVACNQYKSLTDDEAVEILKRLIDGYCDFVTRYCYERTELGLKQYLSDYRFEE